MFFARIPHLPTLLLATMLGIGLVVEAALYGGAQWGPKSLLIVCLAAFVVRRCTRSSKG